MSLNMQSYIRRHVKAPALRKVVSRKYHSVFIHNGIADNDNDTMDYVKGWAYQQSFLHRRLQVQRLINSGEENDSFQRWDQDKILFLEHSPVYTLGRGADEEYLTFLDDVDDGDIIRNRLSRRNRGPDSCRLDSSSLLKHLAPLKFDESDISVDDEVEIICTEAPRPVIAPNDVPIYRIDRGGEVTCHLKSQLVVYPLLDLRREPYQQDLHWYLRSIEEVIIQTLAEYGIEGHRDSINTGVWVGPNKIAAVGISSARWITTHGFALNVNPNLDMFDTSVIIPCGIEGRGVTSISNEIDIGRTVNLLDVSNVVMEKMRHVFGLDDFVNSTKLKL